MQVCVVDKPVDRLLSDVEKMEIEVNTIKECLLNLQIRGDPSSQYKSIVKALATLSDIVLSLDNANDFFKIGGFPILFPLLEIQSPRVVAATCELIADLVQNNSFCQQKALDEGLLSKLVSLLRSSSDTNVCIKALYAISCLCRHNQKAIIRLISLNGLDVLLHALQKPVEKLRTKIAFLFTHLINEEPEFREAVFEANFIEPIIYLLQQEQDSSHEHLLSALLAQVRNHEKSKLECCKEKYGLSNIISQLLEKYEGKGEFQEAKEYCINLRAICFPEK